MKRLIPIVIGLSAIAGQALSQEVAEPFDLPDAVLEAPSPAPVVPTAPIAVAPVASDQPDVAALRVRFEDLKVRQAELDARGQPASSQVLAQIEETQAEITQNEARLRVENWRAENLAGLAGAFATSGPVTLPSGVPAGTEPQIGLALIAPQTTLYSQPATETPMVLRTLEERTTMLRIAEVGPFSMVWSPRDGMAFVLSQFREVY